MALTSLLSSFQTHNIPTALTAVQGHVWGFWVVNSSRPLIREKAEQMAPDQVCSKHCTVQRGGLGNSVTPQAWSQGPLAKSPLK